MAWIGKEQIRSGHCQRLSLLQFNEFLNSFPISISVHCFVFQDVEMAVAVLIGPQ